MFLGAKLIDLIFWQFFNFVARKLVLKSNYALKVTNEP